MVDEKHWLERPETIAKLWRGGWVLLALLLGAEFGYHPHAYFTVDGWFGFHAFYGFSACVAMVLGAKLLGVYLKRGEDYYDRD
ncbi:MAG: hypothetical protein O2967_22025 [Proteobacteria bacterium]|nr:hypothetical protein [Pseudomonadota bacterium]